MSLVLTCTVAAEEMKDLLSKLPERNREVIKKLFRLCSLLCGSKATLLTVTAISICLSPSIAPTEEIGLINMNSFFKIGIEQYDSVVVRVSMFLPHFQGFLSRNET